MADNKKEKVDFKDALKAKANEMTKDPRKEVAHVMVNGLIVPIVRGDMDDEQWADVKRREVEVTKKASGQRVEPTPESRVAGKTGMLASPDQTAEKPSDADAKRIESMGKKMEAQRRSEARSDAGDDELQLSDGRWVGGSRPSSVQAQAARFLTKVTPTQAQGTPETDFASPYPDRSAPVDTRPTLSGAIQQAADYKAAHPDGPSQPVQVKRWFPEGAKDVSSLTPGADAGAVMQLSPSKTSDEVNDVPPPLSPLGSIEETIRSADQTIGEYGQALKDVVTSPVQTLGPIAKMAGGLFRDDGAQPAPVQPQPQVTDPNAKPPPTPTGKGSLEVAGKMVPNSGTPAQKTDPILDQIQKAGATREEALRLLAENDIAATKGRAQVIREGIAEGERMKLENEKRLKAEAQVMQQHTDGLRDLQNQVLTLSKQNVDPNRFWASKNDGQRAAAVIAGALFGFTGQGMQWLQRLDSLVAQDIQAQAADLARRRGLLNDATGIQNNLIAMAEANGLRGDAAFKAAVIAQKESIAQQIELNAMNFAEPNLRLAAQAKAAELRQSTLVQRIGLEQDAKIAAATVAEKLAAADAHRAQSFKLRTGAGGEADKEAPGIRTELAKIEAGLEAVKQARDASKGNAAFDQAQLAFGAVFPGFASQLPAWRRDAVARGAQENVLKVVKGENLLETDIARAEPRWQRPGLNASNTDWLTSMENELIAKKNALLQSHNVGGMKPTAPTVNFTPSK